MKTRFIVYVVYGLLLLIIYPWAMVQAQENPTDALIGTWDGTGVGGTDKGRTIIIKSVKPKEGGGWIAEGNYGLTGKDLIPKMFDVSLKNGKIFLMFKVLDNPGELTLVSGNILQGILRESGIRSRDRILQFKKIEKKEGSQ